MFEKLMAFAFPAPSTKPPRIVEFGAGLGDVVTLMYTSTRYNSLERIEKDEAVTVVLMCHNPHVRELFLWHPKASQMKIMDLNFWWPKEDAERRAFHKLPSAQPFIYEPQKSCNFYPNPEERHIFDYLKSQGPYLLVSASAGSADRNIPQNIYEEAIGAALDRGLKVVVVGRSYKHNGRVELEVKSRPNVTNLIDCLSVPATAKLIERASAVFCCHSAICLLAWYMKKPVFLLYPRHVKEREFDRPAHQYTVGKDFKTTTHLEFGDYKREIFDQFVVAARKASP